MAQDFKLPHEVVRIIASHLGTTLTSLYYRLSSEERKKNMEKYRYSGPKPQTREEGLVMLADAVEAAARSKIDYSDESKLKATMMTL